MIHSGVVEELKSFMSTLTGAWKRRKLDLRQRRPLGVHEEVVKERHLFFHLFDFVPVFVQDMLPDKLWALEEEVLVSTLTFEPQHNTQQ